MLFDFNKRSQDSSVSSSSNEVKEKKNEIAQHEEYIITASGFDRDAFVPPTDKELRRLMWKIDLRIIPYIAILYLCSFLDRVNIGNAKVAGMTEDIDISEDQYNWALSVFFIGYVVFEVPSNLALKVVGPRIWIPSIMVVWGGIMAAMAAVTNGEGLMASRFFLGVAESSSTLAGAFGGVLAYAITFMDGMRGIRGWQWIFIIEAIPTLLFGILTYFVLPDYPEKTSFLNEREREIIVKRITEDAGPATETHFSWNQVLQALLDWKVYVYSLSYICGSICVYSLAMFMPSIVQGMGYTSRLAFIATILNGYSTDKFGERGFHLAGAGFLASMGYVLLVTLQDYGSVALYIAACITTTFAFATNPPIASWFSNNFGGETKRSVAIATVLTIGNSGGAISGHVYRADDAPRYLRGHKTCLGLMLGGMTFAFLMKFLLYLENKRRDNMTPEERRIACEAEELCDKHPDFRYIL
ncbi:major facilitator superfamily domain-containing protein [Zychaea mexicana]|uniref:major facilitator superfamily domain-containing protein n=1 Tax=Zychaea mexicana TaxID=64656 RepID=UPI0022FE3E2F|nr:major facilitator superfamily domain-containing protein [Zychaea mexicana]KAI9490722.1 major facilitator superfamily domain-containing protein [Zychaea mexicana]